ncbi:MAG: aspartate carbamoyltransferase catalytic subunit [SAR202 cluster bacterium]|nr:aspartate carbamoyltransferase catalytic subunit [SAR202 cluster bacterium]
MTLQGTSSQAAASRVAGVQTINPNARPQAGRRHVLDLDDFTPQEVDDVLQNAVAMREVQQRAIRKVPTLRGKSIFTLFYEASTRTRASFEQAGKILSADVINVSSSGSSVEKGETLYDTALTLQAMNADMIVIRHPHSGAPHFLARHLDASVINAGDGAHAHPTQALLDMFTIQQHLGKIKGVKVVIVGDILYSRVARSNLWGLTKMGADVTLCAPPTLLPPDFLNGAKRQKGHPFAGVKIENNVEKALEGADVVMALRLQLERMKAGHLPTLREYSRIWGINPRRMKLAKPNALVMHPGPINEGVEIDPEVAHGAASVIEEQVTNGVAVRMAILYTLVTPAHGGK